MLLMQSDMLKALLFMVFPVVDLVHGPIKSSSPFCQASGFLLAVGIEASDMAVLLIAIHTALYIFRPKQPNGKHGLYPYRRWAYAAYVSFPVLMASLAFVDGPTGYANVGEFCYLPLKPSWSRAMLSWLPRYIILLTILFIYGFIYCYVSFLMKRFSREGSRADRAAESERQQAGAPSVPSAPPLAYQGSAHSSQRHSYDRRYRQNSLSTLTSFDFELGRAQHNAAPYTSDHGYPSSPWTWLGFLASDPAPSHARRDATSSRANLCDDAVSTRPTTSASEPRHLPRRSTAPSQGGSALATPRSPLEPANTLRGPKTWPGTRLDARRPSDSSSISIMPQTGGVTPMSDTRAKIRHQLRLLFIYPLVYTIIWILPFTSHILTWSDDDDSVPFGILVAALVSLCIQGAVNSLLFSVWEKPWRHVRGDRGARGLRVGKGPVVGRTRDEMMVDGRIARVRLGVEIEERRRREGGGKGSRYWWDVADVEAGDEEGLLTP